MMTSLTPYFLRQGGAIVSELLKTKGQYHILAVTRNKKSDKARKLEEAGATLVQADQNDLESVKKAVKGAQIIFGVTDFIGAGSVEAETQQGINMLDAALSTMDTLEAFIWSNLPDARTAKVPYQNVIHFNAKNDIATRMRASVLADVLIQVRLGPYFQNFVKAPQVYGPQKV
jgi:hypothetical protein